MNDATKNFVTELRARSEVLGVILFGSWARGNNRPGSDVDLVVILTEGYQRTVERHEGQVFEIIYTTEKGALDFWATHLDDAAGLWEVAKTLYDKDEVVVRLRERAQELLTKGKGAINDLQKAQLRFDAEDVFGYVESIHETDRTTANLMLANKVFALTELFFDLRQEWTPAPKQRLAIIADRSKPFHSLLSDFYDTHTEFAEKISLVRQMVPIVFGN